MSIAPRASACAPADVEAWMTELGLVPVERADREGVASWDLVLDGRRRAALRVTVILDPSLALICLAHFAPPINDSFRRSYRKLLRWNDELPFVKFSIGEDERPLLVAEIAPDAADRDSLGLALARQLAVADRLHDESAEWLDASGWRTTPPASPGVGPGATLLARYETALDELLAAPDGGGQADPALEVRTADGADTRAGPGTRGSTPTTARTGGGS
jgi:hypothetical protein